MAWVAAWAGGMGVPSLYNKTLKSLDLSSNNVWDMGAMAFTGILFSALGLKSSLGGQQYQYHGGDPHYTGFKQSRL